MSGEGMCCLSFSFFIDLAIFTCSFKKPFLFTHKHFTTWFIPSPLKIFCIFLRAMSSSRTLFHGRRQPGQSNFVQTCNLLSRYIKEKGSLKDLNFEIGGKVESLEAIVKPGSTHFASMNNNILTNKGNLAQMEQQSSMATSNSASQLTIFYSGRVLVFDDCPAEKVEELMALAKRESSSGLLSNVKPSSTSRDGLPPRPHPTATKDKPTATEASNASDLPIARRSSLHRFLEKRKDRAAARGPYHQVQEHAGPSSKGDEQLELKL